MHRTLYFAGFFAVGLSLLPVGCKWSSQPERSSPAPKIVLRPDATKPSENAAEEDCGLGNYPITRSNQEILTDVPHDYKDPPNSDLLAKLAIDKDGRITHIRVLRLAHSNAPNWRKINEDALESIRRQQYKQTFYEGKPVPVCTDVGVIIDLR